MHLPTKFAPLESHQRMCNNISYFQKVYRITDEFALPAMRYILCDEKEYSFLFSLHKQEEREKNNKKQL
uniref:CSON012207 protein n=1 Tax=Culicoides sonorensis TaxID=179676 RepID=A0A336M8S5_CULSO